MNTAGNPTLHKKQICGHVNISARIPLVFEVDAINEVYEDEHGKEYTEEEYEYSVEDILQWNANKDAKKIQAAIQYLKSVGWQVEQIEIEEC